MEDGEEKERGIVGLQHDSKCQPGPPALMDSQNSIPETGQNGVVVGPEMEEKGMEEGDLKKEVEAEVKVELCQSGHGLQVSFIRDTDLFGYVGIEAVLDQMRRKTMKAGLEFNIMVVGESETHHLCARVLHKELALRVCAGLQNARVSCRGFASVSGCPP